MENIEVKFAPATIGTNLQTVKEELNKNLKKYENIIVTKETLKDCKKTKADLNKMVTTVENERKRIKKIINEPYLELEKEFKTVKGLIDKVIEPISYGIKELEDKETEEKMAEIENLIQEKAAFLSGGILGEYPILEINPKWLNKSYKMSNISEEIVVAYQELTKKRENIKGIIDKQNKKINSKIEYTDYMINFKTETLAMISEIITKADTIYKAENEPVVEVEKPVEQVVAEVVSDSTEPYTEPMFELPKEPLYTANFEITATVSELRLVKQYLEQISVEFTNTNATKVDQYV